MKYRIKRQVLDTWYYEVEADSEEEAIDYVDEHHGELDEDDYTEITLETKAD